MSDSKKFALILLTFLFFYFIPADSPRVSIAASEALAMLHEYAREHVLLCLIPAFIAGAISVFISQQSVIKYLGSNAKVHILFRCSGIGHSFSRMFLHCSSYSQEFTLGAEEVLLHVLYSDRLLMCWP